MTTAPRAAAGLRRGIVVVAAWLVTVSGSPPQDYVAKGQVPAVLPAKDKSRTLLVPVLAIDLGHMTWWPSHLSKITPRHLRAEADA